VRARRVHANALALVTVLALLVAPVCAPICAARACASRSSDQRCHEMAGISTQGGEHLIAQGKSCGAVELYAVLVDTGERSTPSQELRNVPPHLIASDHSDVSLGPLDAHPDGWPLHRGPLGWVDSPQSPMILRI
jgi:hypothetical protein